MATATLDLHWHHGSFPGRAPAPPEGDDFADLFAPPVRSARWVRRQRAVRAAGCVLLLGLSAFAAWMATATDAGDAMAVWGTLGNPGQVRLATLSRDDADPVTPELVPASMMAWETGPARAEPERWAFAAVEPPRSPSSAAEPFAASWPVREDDPYVGVIPPERTPAADPDGLDDREFNPDGL